MIALDTSVAVPALADWHELHDLARPRSVGTVLPAHARLEVYSVLTRVPAPYRQPPEVIAAVLAARFPADSVLGLPVPTQRGIVERLQGAGITGGAVYDGLVALTAAAHGARLLTADERAGRTYAALDVPYELLERG